MKNNGSSSSLRLQITRTTSLAAMVALLCGSLFLAPRISAQINSTWLGDGIGDFSNGNWSNAAFWNPSSVPNNSGPSVYNVSITYHPGVAQFNGPELDQNVTIENLTLIDRVFITNQASGDIGTTLTVNGTTSITTLPAMRRNVRAFYQRPGSSARCKL